METENTNSCIIEGLIKRPFLERSKVEQNEIIKTGRPTPVLPNLTKKYQNINRHFNTRHYVRYEWLTGSEKMNKLFCWHCLLFEDRKQGKYLWASVGYSDMRQLVMAATRHAFSQNHHKSMLEYHKFQESLQINNSIPKQNVKKATIRRCIINQILGSPFLDRPMKEQLEIFHNNRPIPPMPLLFSYDLTTNTKVGFQTENYLKYKWMAGSQKLNRLYCWQCLLFADTSLNEEWISIGFNKMDNFETSVHNHETSDLHKDLENKYEEFKKSYINFIWNETPIDDDIFNENPNDDNIFNEESRSTEDEILVDNFLSTEIQPETLEECISNDTQDINNFFESFNADSIEEMEQQSDENNLQDCLDENDCVIQQILQTRFSKFTENLQKQILSIGRPVPDTSQFSKLGNVFYNKYDWLTASVQTSKYYCWYCLLMKEPYDNNFWGEEGLPYARNIPKRIEKHTKSNIHIICTSKYIELKAKFEICVRPLKLNRATDEDPNSIDNLLEKYKDENCVIIQLLRNKFENCSSDEQKSIFENGRPTPKLPNLQTMYCGRQRFFRPIYYQKYEWLCGSEKLNKLFCWYCLLFGKSVWGREGISNICKLTDGLKKHDNVRSHTYCLGKYQKFGKTEEEFEKTTEDLQTQQLVSNILTSSSRCLINELLGYPFCDRPLENQIEIVNNGRPTPGSNGEQFIENFANINYFKYIWLTGSQKLNKLFCWPCLLFADSKSANIWVQIGFDKIRKLSTAASKHETSNVHIQLVKKLNKFKNNYGNEELLSVIQCETVCSTDSSV